MNPMGQGETWRRLMSAKRLGTEDSGEQVDARSAFQRDFDRIVFSSAFRRLQDKTQVFPLAESDYVRTRLTHSIEVSCVGRSLGTIVGTELANKYKFDELAPSDFGAVVAAGALAHDIGNPPFGHSGEDAIQHWFQTSEIAKDALSGFNDQQKNDFLKFEGNAQGFRVLTKLQSPDNSGGMQLTNAVLGAFTKYPRASHLDGNPADYSGISAKKHGFFTSECEHYQMVAKSTGVIERSKGAYWKRHPLAFLVEAADDICYRIIDLEDGFRLGYVDFRTTQELLVQLIGSDMSPQRLGKITGEKEKVEYLRAKAINTLIFAAADLFLENESEILLGQFDSELISNLSDKQAALGDIKTLSRKKVYSARPVLEVEAAGYEVLGGMLDMFVEAVNEVAQKAQPHPKSKKLLQLMPPQFLGVDQIPDPDPYYRLIKVTDFVCGMTDGFAVSTFKKIRGISLPHA
jgi:dGTPase